MALEILIDGYNFIHKWNFLKEKFQKNPENARDFLVEILGKYRKAKKHNIKLVFDAYNSFNFKPSHFNIKGITVCYTSTGETADDFIKEKVKLNGEKYIVITSDNSIKEFANKCGATVLNSEDFVNKLEFLFYMDYKGIESEEDDYTPRIHTKKKGNPRKLPKKLRKKINKIKKL